MIERRGFMPPLRKQPVHAQLLHSLYCKVYLDNSAVLLYQKKKNPMKFPEGNKESVIHKQVEEKKKIPSCVPFHKMKAFSSCLLHVFGGLHSGPGKDKAAQFPCSMILSKHPLVLVNILESMAFPRISLNPVKVPIRMVYADHKSC